MQRTRIIAGILVVVLLAVGYFNYASEVKTEGFFSRFPFRLGLDLNGGTELTYRADVSQVALGEVDDRMDNLRDLIERRVNPNGTGEQVVLVEKSGIPGNTQENKLIVDLPGVTDVKEAVLIIGKTPTLDFRLLSTVSTSTIQAASTTKAFNALFVSSGLTGRFLESAQVEFSGASVQPVVSLVFNSEGKDLFAKITREHKGQVLAIFLDGQPISTPVINDEIKDGKAQISGSFTPAEAKELANNLKNGALPVPIELVGTQTIGASLGQEALHAGIKAGLWGFALVALFLILWYRLPGFIASISLIMYVALSLAVFKLIPVTLTAAGLAGFILSIGMAVDANILIFERMKEEFKRGKNISDGMHEGFHRAWLSIRDSNISSIITAIVLFWLGTSAVKGFALTFGLGVLISMFTAITASRTFLFAVAPKKEGKLSKFLFSNGLHTN